MLNATKIVNKELNERLKVKANEDSINEWYKNELVKSNMEFLNWIERNV